MEPRKRHDQGRQACAPHAVANQSSERGVAQLLPPLELSFSHDAFPPNIRLRRKYCSGSSQTLTSPTKPNTSSSLRTQGGASAADHSQSRNNRANDRNSDQ